MTNKIPALFEMRKGDEKAFIQLWYSEIGQEGGGNIDPQLIGEQPVEALNLYIKGQKSVCRQCNEKKTNREDGEQEFGCCWHDPQDLFGNRYAICISCWKENKMEYNTSRVTHLVTKSSTGTLTYNVVMSQEDRARFDKGVFLMEEYKEFEDRPDLARV